MNALPTNPPRYLSFFASIINTRIIEPKVMFWRIIENGEAVTRSLTFDAVLVLWAADPPATVYDELHEEFVPLVLGA